MNGFEPRLLHFADSRYGYTSPYLLLWPLAKTRGRPRHWNYVQWCCVCIFRSWRSPPNPIRYEASICPDFYPRKWRRTRDRYPNTSNPGSAKVPSTLYYDRDGKFCGVENGVDFQDENAFLRIRWWGTAIHPHMQDTDDKLGGS